MIKIVSWNINSVRLRLNLVKEFAQKENPDILCLQETKVKDDDFPYDAIKSMGFDHVYFNGEKSYNGVAIFSKLALSDIEKIDILGYGHARHISAKLPNGARIYNFYIPAGGDEPDVKINPKFDHKLKFVDFMADYFRQKYDQNQDKLIILGDFNIAPHENDVWSHKQLLKIVSHTPIEVEKLNKVQSNFNFIDCHRYFASFDDKLYSWWSYRNRDWKKSNRGRRLDHIWISQGLKNNLKNSDILKDYRDAIKPSDHAPIIVNIEYS